MPVVTVTWLPGRTVEQRRELAQAITRDVAEIGRCAPESVALVFQEVAPDAWAEGGKLLGDRA